MHQKRRGFTLIELLVVVSIIGMLASMVLASLNSARLRGKDAVIISEVRQLVNLFEMQKTSTNSYAGLQNGGWFTVTFNCATGFAVGGNNAYTDAARSACQAIIDAHQGVDSTLVTANGYDSSFANYLLYINNTVSVSSAFSIMASLPGQKKWFCVSSTGRSGIYSNYHLQPGCHNNI